MSQEGWPTQQLREEKWHLKKCEEEKQKQEKKARLVLSYLPHFGLKDLNLTHKPIKLQLWAAHQLGQRRGSPYLDPEPSLTVQLGYKSVK